MFIPPHKATAQGMPERETLLITHMGSTESPRGIYGLAAQNPMLSITNLKRTQPLNPNHFNPCPLSPETDVCIDERYFVPETGDAHAQVGRGRGLANTALAEDNGEQTGIKTKKLASVG